MGNRRRYLSVLGNGNKIFKKKSEIILHNNKMYDDDSWNKKLLATKCQKRFNYHSASSSVM